MTSTVTRFPGRRRLRVVNPPTPIAQMSGAIDELYALSHARSITPGSVRALADRLEAALERLMKERQP